MTRDALIDLAYLLTSVLFILGIKGLTHPRTALRGNLMAAFGMLLAVLVTLVDRQIVGYATLAAGLAVGALLGAVMAVKVQMTDMPQLVALFNGFGGGASVLVAGGTLLDPAAAGIDPSARFALATMASGAIGAVTFWGSLIAFAKLQDLMTGNPVVFAGQQVVNGLLFLAVIGMGGWSVMAPASVSPYLVTVAAASIFGLTLVLPVGGADMPVVVALLNSFSGMAGVAVGFVLSNSVLIISGALVGASGLILTHIMCKAMNRSLMNVLLGLGTTVGARNQDADIYAGKVKAASAEEVAMLFESAHRVVIVPGYGLAVSQAQFSVRDLYDLLTRRGVEVDFAVHPVAGRMPGHMNILLAEADIPYERLREMDDINHEFEQVDLVLVVGANDVVNPAARTDPTSPIAGMPILDVDKARTVVVIKRSLSPGYAGIPNPLFAADKTVMLFADAGKALVEIIGCLKS